MITASIVIYKTSVVELEAVLNSVINSSINTVYLIDNSPLNASLKQYATYSKKIVYVSNPTNPGFGAAHNIAIKRSIELNNLFHFIINPDVVFNGEIIELMIKYMLEHKDVGMLMPKILYPNGNMQYLPKLLPSPFDLIFRKIKRPKRIYQQFIRRYEFRDTENNKVYNVPIISGCFSLLNLAILKEVGAYDERFFMYFEDFDLSRRIHEKYETLYFPFVSVFHRYDGGANKKWKLFWVFINSAIKYFNKWGWFFDIKRRKINEKALTELYQK